MVFPDSSRTPSTIERIFEVQSDGVDLVLAVPIRFGIGWALPKPELIPYLPEGRICFWGGWGGSLIVVDLDARMTVAYMMNRMGEGTVGDDRAHTILRACYQTLGS